MNKYWCTVILLMFFFSIPVAVSANGIEVEVNGKTVEFINPPHIENGYILVPAREFFTLLGAVVSWDGKTKATIAVKDKVRVNIPVGSNVATVNDVPVQVDVPAMIIGSHVYIPLRFAAESLGGEVNWEAGSSIVSITTSPRKLDSRGGGGRDPAGIYGGKININAAGVDELVGIKGVSKEIAEKILAHRETFGPYKSFGEIKDLPSVDDALFKILKANLIISYKEKGQGCYYGNEFHGNKTSSGEIYDKNLYTAAHRTLPFGTMVKVTFPETARSVWVRINDRGPHAPGRIIDLSAAAANAIGLTPYGIGRVELEGIIEG